MLFDLSTSFLVLPIATFYNNGENVVTRQTGLVENGLLDSGVGRISKRVFVNAKTDRRCVGLRRPNRQAACQHGNQSHRRYRPPGDQGQRPPARRVFVPLPFGNQRAYAREQKGGSRGCFNLLLVGPRGAQNQRAKSVKLLIVLGIFSKHGA
jgi:hypothetical protein